MRINSEFYEAVLKKAKKAFAVDSDKQLAEAIGLTRSTITEARKRNTIPHKNLIEAIIESDKEISLDWIFNTGTYRNKKSSGAA